METIYFVFTCMPCKSKCSFHDPDFDIIKSAGDLICFLLLKSDCCYALVCFIILGCVFHSLTSLR